MFMLYFPELPISVIGGGRGPGVRAVCTPPYGCCARSTFSIIFDMFPWALFSALILAVVDLACLRLLFDRAHYSISTLLYNKLLCIVLHSTYVYSYLLGKPLCHTIG